MPSSLHRVKYFRQYGTCSLLRYVQFPGDSWQALHGLLEPNHGFNSWTNTVSQDAQIVNDLLELSSAIRPVRNQPCRLPGCRNAAGEGVPKVWQVLAQLLRETVHVTRCLFKQRSCLKPRELFAVSGGILHLFSTLLHSVSDLSDCRRNPFRDRSRLNKLRFCSIQVVEKPQLFAIALLRPFFVGMFLRIGNLPGAGRCGSGILSIRA